MKFTKKLVVLVVVCAMMLVSLSLITSGDVNTSARAPGGGGASVPSSIQVAWSGPTFGAPITTLPTYPDLPGMNCEVSWNS
jgi:hypothetical protein